MNRFVQSLLFVVSSVMWENCTTMPRYSKELQ